MAGDTKPGGHGGAEAYCPQCERSYSPESKVCPDDGASLVHFRNLREHLVGKVLAGRFEITAEIGNGGMGSVYRARQTSVGRDVAVKIIDPSLSRDREASKRFLREAKLCSRLAQPNTVVVHDFGQDQGVLYIVMELVVGRTLRDLLRETGALPAARIRRIGVQLCDALEAAHSMGVIHRDLKPSNIMILDQPVGRDVVKVLDFGLAKSLVSDTGTTSITQSGAVMGTPLYMAPEMIHGQPADERADLYSLGCILHEMATGAPPFVATTTSAVFAKHLTESPHPLDRPDLGPAQVMIERLLYKDVEQRPSSAAVVREALLDHRPSTSDGVAPVRPASKTASMSTAPTLTAASARAAAERATASRPRRWPYALLALVIALAAGGVAWKMGTDGDREEPVADSPTVPAVAPPAVADAAVETAQPAAEPDAAAAEPPAQVRVTIPIDSRPHADVYIGGKKVGRTPYEHTVAGGTELMIEFRRSGYDTERSTITAATGVSVHARLARRKKAPPASTKPPGDEPPDVDFIKPKNK